MLGPMPALAVQPVCASIWDRMLAATSSGPPSPVTSRNASSQDSACTAAVCFSMILYTCSCTGDTRA